MIHRINRPQWYVCANTTKYTMSFFSGLFAQLSASVRIMLMEGIAHGAG